MGKRVLVILISKRTKNALEVQKLLTEYGCIIKTRLGIHDGVANSCNEDGLVMIELAGDKAEGDKLVEKLQVIDGIAVKDVELSI